MLQEFINVHNTYTTVILINNRYNTKKFLTYKSCNNRISISLTSMRRIKTTQHKFVYLEPFVAGRDLHADWYRVHSPSSSGYLGFKDAPCGKIVLPPLLYSDPCADSLPTTVLFLSVSKDIGYSFYNFVCYDKKKPRIYHILEAATSFSLNDIMT